MQKRLVVVTGRKIVDMALETVFHAAAQRIEVWWNGACRLSVGGRCFCRETGKAQFLVGTRQRRIRERERELPRAEKPCDGPPCHVWQRTRTFGTMITEQTSANIGNSCERRASLTFLFNTARFEQPCARDGLQGAPVKASDRIPPNPEPWGSFKPPNQEGPVCLMDGRVIQGIRGT